MSIAFDNKGRLIASDQGGKGLYRITLPAIGTDEETRVQKLNIGLSSAQGMLYAFDSLYVPSMVVPAAVSIDYRIQPETISSIRWRNLQNFEVVANMVRTRFDWGRMESQSM